MRKPDIYDGYDPLFPDFEKSLALTNKLKLAQKLCNANDNERAIEVLKEAIEISDEKKDIPLFVIANCYFLMDDMRNACHYYRLAYDAIYAKSYNKEESWLGKAAVNV